MKYTIYKATINDKLYIGVTSQSPFIRWKQHINDAIRHRTNYIFHNALRKSKFSVKWDILHDNISSPEEAMNLERYYIGTWVNKTQCAKELNLSRPNMRKVLNGNNTHTKGYILQYIEEEEYVV